MTSDNESKHLNDAPGFNWVAAGGNDDGLGKASIAGECFWIKDCTEGEDGLWRGTVDNFLLFSDEHNLFVGDAVTFRVEVPDPD